MDIPWTAEWQDSDTLEIAFAGVFPGLAVIGAPEVLINGLNNDWEVLSVADTAIVIHSLTPLTPPFAYELRPQDPNVRSSLGGYLWPIVGSYAPLAPIIPAQATKVSDTAVRVRCDAEPLAIVIAWQENAGWLVTPPVIEGTANVAVSALAVGALEWEIGFGAIVDENQQINIGAAGTFLAPGGYSSTPATLNIGV